MTQHPLLGDLRTTLRSYLERFPADTAPFASLLERIDRGDDVTSRAVFDGHVTVSAVVVNDADEVLLVHHRALDRWLPPGGHIEPQDRSLRDAALRELAEETGIDLSSVRPAEAPFDTLPIHIDRHRIPAHERKNEPAHDHYDLRFAFRCDASALTPQEAEVKDVRWRDRSLLQETLRARLAAIGSL